MLRRAGRLVICTALIALLLGGIGLQNVAAHLGTHPLIATELGVLRGHDGAVQGVAFSPTGLLIASAGADTSIRLWNSVTREETATLFEHTSFAADVAFNPAYPEGEESELLRLASASWDGTTIFWDVTPPGDATRTGTTDAFSGTVARIAYSPDGSLLALAVGDGTARIIDAATGELVRTLELDGGLQVNAVAFSPDGSLLATATGFPGTSAELWDVETGELLNTLQGHTGSVTSLDFNPDGSLLATAGDDGFLVLWDVATGEGLVGLDQEVWVTDVAFAPHIDGSKELLALALLDGRVYIWDVTDPLAAVEVGFLDGHKQRVNAVAFAPRTSDRRWMVATASDDATIRLWEVVD